VAHGRIVANAARDVARQAHADMTLDVPSRHRKAQELSAKAVLPFVSTYETAKKAVDKELVPLGEKLSGPTGEFSELQLTEARTKLSGMKAPARFAAITKSIDKGLRSPGRGLDEERPVFGRGLPVRA
jgi:hypothetical protein